ncbi:MAG: Uma2 family endonuclease [Cyanobacteria bacterium J06621_15]
MVEQILVSEDNFDILDANKLVTEDDTPVDNFASEKQQRLLASSLYSSLQNQTFLAAANVGIYHIYKQPPIVPDVFLSFDVQTPENWWEKRNRCYLMWEFGKPPEVVIEIVSNKIGDELGDKLKTYERMRVSYYIVYDPTQQLGEQQLRIYELVGRRFRETSETWLEQVELGLTLWSGEFEGRQDTWLRWCYQDDTVLPTGDERAQVAEQQIQAAQQQAENEKQQKEQALSRAEILAQKLREMGVNPDDLD